MKYLAATDSCDAAPSRALRPLLLLVLVPDLLLTGVRCGALRERH